MRNHKILEILSYLGLLDLRVVKAFSNQYKCLYGLDSLRTGLI